MGALPVLPLALPGRLTGEAVGMQRGDCTYVPSELLLLVLPSVDSRLPWRVTRLRISTAMPVSVLRRMLLRSFLVAPSVTTTKHREQGQITHAASLRVLPKSPSWEATGWAGLWRQGTFLK